MNKIKNNEMPNFLWYSLSLNGLNAFIPEGVKESRTKWLDRPKNIENTSKVRLIFKEGINPILTKMINTAIPTKNIGHNLLLRNNKARAIIRIKKIIKFLGLLKSRS